MLRKFILIASLCFSFAFAQISQDEAISAIKANPTLLNTPAAQAEMAKLGISKSKVLSKIGTTDSNTTDNNTTNKTTIKKATNNLKSQKKIADVIIEKRAYNLGSVFINPLQYKQNDIILKEVKAKQSIKYTKNLTRYGINFFQ